MLKLLHWYLAYITHKLHIHLVHVLEHSQAMVAIDAFVFGLPIFQGAFFVIQQSQQQMLPCKNALLLHGQLQCRLSSLSYGAICALNRYLVVWICS